MHAQLSSRARSARRTVTVTLATIGLLFGYFGSFTGASAQAITLDLQFFAAISGVGEFAVAPEAVLHSPEGDYVGRDGLAQFGADLEATLGDIRFATTAIDQAGTMTIVSFVLSSGASGCADVEVPGVAMLQSDASGVVVEQWISYDSDAIASLAASGGCGSTNQADDQSPSADCHKLNVCSLP